VWAMQWCQNARRCRVIQAYFWSTTVECRDSSNYQRATYSSYTVFSPCPCWVWRGSRGNRARDTKNGSKRGGTTFVFAVGFWQRCNYTAREWTNCVKYARESSVAAAGARRRDIVDKTPKQLSTRCMEPCCTNG